MEKYFESFMICLENLSVIEVVIAFLVLVVTFFSLIVSIKGFLLNKRINDDEKKNKDVFFKKVECSRSMWERMPNADSYLLVERAGEPAKKMENLSIKISFYNNFGEPIILDEMFFEIVFRKKHVSFPVLDKKIKHDLSIEAKYQGDSGGKIRVQAPYTMFDYDEAIEAFYSLQEGLMHSHIIYWDNDNNQKITENYNKPQHNYFLIPHSNQLYNWEIIFLIPIDSLKKIAKYGYNIHSIRARFPFQHRTIDLECRNFSFEIFLPNKPFIVANQKNYYSEIKHPLQQT
jgi:hypothetical protein